MKKLEQFREDVLWQTIDSLTWHKCKDEKKLSDYLASKYTKKEIVTLKNFEVEKRLELIKKWEDYLYSLPKLLKKLMYFNFNRYDLFAVTSNIVGSGEAMFNFFMNNIHLLPNAEKNTDNIFEYVFDFAMTKAKEQ